MKANRKADLQSVSKQANRNIKLKNGEGNGEERTLTPCHQSTADSKIRYDVA